GDARYDLDPISIGHTSKDVNEAAVEEWIALAEKCDVTPAIQFGGECGGSIVIDRNGDRPRPHRKADRDLPLMRFDPRGDDRTGEAGAMLRRWIRDHRDFPQEPKGFDGHQLRVARSYAETV